MSRESANSASRMWRDAALSLARQIATEEGGVHAYCRRHGMVYSTTISRAFRAGVNLGSEVRRERLERAAEMRASGISATDAAFRAGFSSLQAMYRARRSPMLARLAAAPSRDTPSSISHPHTTDAVRASRTQERKP